MLKKWFIEKCCFTDYCTVQLYKIVLKAWKQSALERLQHPVLRQPRTWESRVGEAALLSCPGWSWQLEELSQLSQELRPAGINPRGAPWQHKQRLPPLESVSPGLGAPVSTEEELHFCAFSRWEERSSQLCSTLEPWQFLNRYLSSCSRCDRWIQRDSLWLGGSFLFKMLDSHC